MKRHFNGKTSLHFAIETKMGKALKEFIRRGTNVNRVLRNGYIEENNRKEIVEFLYAQTLISKL
ncbi:MAG: hypothetical protein WBD50_02700 [Candidatus Rhabdochlamydia sp.]